MNLCEEKKKVSNSLQITTHSMHTYLIIIKTDTSTDDSTYWYVKLIWMPQLDEFYNNKKCYLIQPLKN